MNQKKAGKIRSSQKQSTQPGIEATMNPPPEFEDFDYKGSDKLANKIAIVTGGDSGIGRAVAVYFAIEGADVVITYLNEHQDAAYTKKMVESKGRRCIAIPGNVADYKFCQAIVSKTIKNFKKIDIIVNNSAVQYPQENFAAIDMKQLDKTFKTNIYSYFYMTHAALGYLKAGASIVNTTSVTAYKGSAHLIDYSSTKGAIVAFTRSLSANLITKGIRVNAVAPGPIWTPLIVASFSAKELEKFGTNVPMGRPGETKEVAPSYVFLASEDASYMSGQVLHPNGGVIVND